MFNPLSVFLVSQVLVASGHVFHLEFYWACNSNHYGKRVLRNSLHSFHFSALLSINFFFLTLFCCHNNIKRHICFFESQQSKHSNIMINSASVILLLFVCFAAERYLLGHRLVQNVPSHGHPEARLWLPGQH